MKRTHLQKRSGYTVVWNDLMLPADKGGPGLSNAAIGLLVRMLSKPDDWDFAADRLAGECKEGRAAILNQLAELEEAGYLWRPTRRVAGGTFVTVVYISDEPRYKGWSRKYDDHEQTLQDWVTNVQRPNSGPPTLGACDDSTSPESQAGYQGATYGVSARAERVPPAMIEIAREAEAGTIRKRGAERERDVSDEHARAPRVKRKRSRSGPLTDAQRCYGIAERFREQALEAFPGEAMQASTDGVYKTLRRVRQESPDVTVEQLDRASEMFFEQAASLHRPGVPAWQNFLYRIPRLVEAARREGGAGDAALEGAELAAWLDDDESAKRGPMTKEELAKWLD